MIKDLAFDKSKIPTTIKAYGTSQKSLDGWSVQRVAVVSMAASQLN